MSRPSVSHSDSEKPFGKYSKAPPLSGRKHVGPETKARAALQDTAAAAAMILNPDRTRSGRPRPLTFTYEGEKPNEGEKPHANRSLDFTEPSELQLYYYYFFLFCTFHNRAVTACSWWRIKAALGNNYYLGFTNAWEKSALRGQSENTP